MAEKNNNLVIGSLVDVRFSFNTDSDTASIFDPGFSTVTELAQFPALTRKSSIQSIDNYDNDFTSKLNGDMTLNSSQLVVNEVPGDATQEALKQAARDRKLVRFQNLYIIDSGDNPTGQQTASYQIYDAYVSGFKSTGDSSSVSQIAFDIAPASGIIAEGVSQTGEVLRQGDFGVGAGTEDFPGPKDTSSFIGNSWRTMMGSNSDNPIKADTTLIHSQPNETKAWQILGTVEGTPELHVRNIQKSGTGISKSKWAKVYTDLTRPTPADINAVAKAGDTMTGDLKIVTPGTAQASLQLNDGLFRVNGADGNRAMVISANKSPIYLRPNGDLSQDGEFKFEPSGKLIAPSVVAQAVKIASQGTDNDDAMRYDTWKNKSFIRQDTAVTNNDWNNLTQVGIYKIHGNTGANAPGLYTHGILTVYQAGADQYNENRLVQVYYPHRTGADTSNGIAFRIRNSGVWMAWDIVRNENYNDNKYVKKAGDTMTGLLTITDGGIELGNAKGIWARTSPADSGRRLIAQIDASNKVTLGDKMIPTQIWSSTNPTVVVGSSQYTFYHTGNKPTKTDVGLGNVLDTRQLKYSGDSTTGAFTFGSLNLTAGISGGATGKEAINAEWVKAFGFSGIGSVTSHDWNTLVTQGSYTVNMGGNRGANAPAGDNGFTGIYGYGILNVTTGDHANNGRVLQEYISHEGPNTSPICRVARRIMNTSSGVVSWTPWRYFQSTSDIDAQYVGKTGDTMSGILKFSNASQYISTDKTNVNGDEYTVGHSNVGGWAFTVKEGSKFGRQLYGINPQGRFVFRAGNGPVDSGIAPTSDLEVIHVGNINTTLKNRYLWRVDNLPQLTKVSTAAPSSGAQADWYKLATLPETTTGNTNVMFQIYGATDYGRTRRPVETINFSTRNLGTQTPTNANIATWLSHTRIGIQEIGDITSGSARFGLVRNGKTIELWMKTPTYYQANTTNITLLHNNGGAWLADNAPPVTTEPAGIVYVSPADVYTTLQPPKPSELADGGSYTKSESDSRYLTSNNPVLAGNLTVKGSITSVGVITSQNSLKATGGGNPGSGGAHIQWNVSSSAALPANVSGAMHLTNHYGTGTGGWLFESKGNGESNQKRAAFLNRNGQLELEQGVITQAQSNFNGIVHIAKGSKITAQRTDKVINAVEVGTDNRFYLGDEASSTVIRALNLIIRAGGKEGAVYSELNKPTAAAISAVAINDTYDEGTF
ncbi:hypothetical protein KGP17_17660 [Serratia sp. JSRIV001]|uniref:pyocin knob domain-containing protein n=1 Tax=Serratia sp. JSRIV001 TaxID=2831893 RepID=UPI001CBA8D0E|nr:pyocin knob domain-containing protein [Serratia sp. JSRIV001]UAN44280.1 hypothetical protein KGP17_17660 [Serratia sp. JSRIV001]